MRAAVFVANLFMLGFGLESCIRGVSTEETCEFPLAAFIIVQLALIMIIQVAAPVLLLIYSSILSPTLAMACFLFQWVWLVLGWVWAFGPSNCESSAPQLYNGGFWLTLVYTVVVPIETAWYARVYMAAAGKSGRLDVDSLPYESYGVGETDSEHESGAGESARLTSSRNEQGEDRL